MGEGRPPACRRCGAALVALIDEVKIHRCVICQYGTYAGGPDRFVVPLEQLGDYVGGGAPFLADQPTTDATVSALRRLRRAALERVQREVDADRLSATQFLLQLLDAGKKLADERATTSTRDMSRPYRIVQLVYALLLRHAPLVLGAPPPATLAPFFVKEAFSILGDVSMLSTFLTSVRHELVALSIENRQLVVVRLPLQDEMYELGHNVAGPAGASEPILSLDNAALVEAQRAAFGVAVHDLLALLSPKYGDLGVSGRHEGRVAFIDLERSSDAGCRVVEAFTLTRAQLEAFDAPFFFDRGPRAAAPRAGDRWIDEAADALWLAYYPFLEAQRLDQLSSKVAITTMDLVQRCVATMDGAQSHLLHVARREVARRDASAAAHIDALVRDYHARFEQATAALFSAAGMQARAGVESLGKKRLACGEIDVLAGASSSDHLTLVVCEVKNVDLSLQKDGGYAHLAATLERARDQVGRKAGWVAENAAMVAEWLSLPVRSTTVVGLVITRRPVPLSMLGRWPGALLAEVPDVARALMRAPSEWRGDLRNGIVNQEP
jgi:hypothetical protein